MKNMEKRLRGLERRKPVLSPEAKRWLGHTLSESEETELANEPEPSEPDFSGISAEAREWLGLPSNSGKQLDTLGIS